MKLFGLTRKQTNHLFRILGAGVLLLLNVILLKAGVLPKDRWYVTVPVFLVPYLLVGWDVLWAAIRNVANGQLLDEHFLMMIATIGAFVLGEYPEAVFVMLFYQVGELFQNIAVGRSRKSIAALMDIRPDVAVVERDGAEVTVSPDEVRIGEVIVVRPGEKIPLDGSILEGESELNTVSLTGESALREVAAGDSVISGCVNVSGLLRVKVEKPFGESTVSKILELVENSELVKSKTENTVTRFARIYTPSVVAGAVLLALIPSFITGDWARWINTALIFLVVSCPCALVISVPLSYFGGLGAASRRGVLIKGSNHLEALANLKIAVFDKTGTLTKGTFAVSAVHPEGMAEAELLRLAAAAEQYSNHPIAQSLREAATAELPAATDVEELAGYGVGATVEGHRVLVGNRRLMEKEGIAFTVPAGLGTVILVACDGSFAGSVLISDIIKPEAAEALAELRRNGVDRQVMLSGDRREVAMDVAKKLNIDECHAELLPGDKAELVGKMLAEKTSGTLAFVGDGVNDAPVLARADVGIAMGALGSDAAIEAADVVLMDDDPRGIAQAVKIARRTRVIVWENITLALVVKLGFMALSVFNLVGMWAATFADVGVAIIAILNAMRTGK
ncbi:MAG: heavy metal translocating P-type ATPase [Eubacteriales bacterium]|nr:heavy metal translocating P-type ATPase [Eubacteriales bacterium]